MTTLSPHRHHRLEGLGRTLIESSIFIPLFAAMALLLSIDAHATGGQQLLVTAIGAGIGAVLGLAVGLRTWMPFRWRGDKLDLQMEAIRAALPPRDPERVARLLAEEWQRLEERDAEIRRRSHVRARQRGGAR